MFEKKYKLSELLVCQIALVRDIERYGSNLYDMGKCHKYQRYRKILLCTKEYNWGKHYTHAISGSKYEELDYFSKTGEIVVVQERPLSFYLDSMENRKFTVKELIKLEKNLNEQLFPNKDADSGMQDILEK